jgi:hypothetical protein
LRDLTNLAPAQTVLAHPGLRSESNFRFRCFCNGPLVVKLRVHPIAGFVLLSVVGVRPPLHAV